MYVTRPLSMYRRSPSTLSIPPPDAPYSGYLVITDEEAEAEDACCWRLFRRKRVKKLPFPQDKIFSITHGSEYEQTSNTKVWFLPVPDHPLSSNRYYVIRAKGRNKGYVSQWIALLFCPYGLIIKLMLIGFLISKPAFCAKNHLAIINIYTSTTSFLLEFGLRLTLPQKLA